MKWCKAGGVVAELRAQRVRGEDGAEEKMLGEYRNHNNVHIAPDSVALYS